MEFWGVKVKSGQTLSVQPGDGMILHLSQASSGKVKKDEGSEFVRLSVKVDGKKIVLGTINLHKLPQHQFDLFFDKDFELSHNLKSGSVYFCGYKTANPYKDEDEEGSDEDIPTALANNSKEKSVESGDEDDIEESDSVLGLYDDEWNEEESNGETTKKYDDEWDDEESNGETTKKGEDESDEEESNMEITKKDEDKSGKEESNMETTKKSDASKKRPAGPATKTPDLTKKAKSATQKTDGKKAVHVAGNKPNQSPKSGGLHVCKTCNRTFGSEGAVESNSKVKHSDAK